MTTTAPVDGTLIAASARPINAPVRRARHYLDAFRSAASSIQASGAYFALTFQAPITRSTLPLRASPPLRSAWFARAWSAHCACPVAREGI